MSTTSSVAAASPYHASYCSPNVTTPTTHSSTACAAVTTATPNAVATTASSYHAASAAAPITHSSAAVTTATSNSVAMAVLTPVASAFPQPIVFSSFSPYSTATGAAISSTGGAQANFTSSAFIQQPNAFSQQPIASASATTVASQPDFTSYAFSQYRDCKSNAPSQPIASASAATAASQVDASTFGEREFTKRRRVEKPKPVLLGHGPSSLYEAFNKPKPVFFASGGATNIELRECNDIHSYIKGFLFNVPPSFYDTSYAELERLMMDAKSLDFVMQMKEEILKAPLNPLSPILHMTNAIKISYPIIVKAKNDLMLKIITKAKKDTIRYVEDILAKLYIEQSTAESNSKLHSKVAPLQVDNAYNAVDFDTGKMHLEAVIQLFKIWNNFTDYLDRTNKVIKCIEKPKSGFDGSDLFFIALNNAKEMKEALKAFPKEKYGEDLEDLFRSLSNQISSLIAAANVITEVLEKVSKSM